MKRKLVLCLAVVLGIVFAGSAVTAPSEIALATRSGKLDALSEKLQNRDKEDRRQKNEQPKYFFHNSPFFFESDRTTRLYIAQMLLGPCCQDLHHHI